MGWEEKGIGVVKFCGLIQNCLLVVIELWLSICLVFIVFCVIVIFVVVKWCRFCSGLFGKLYVLSIGISLWLIIYGVLLVMIILLGLVIKMGIMVGFSVILWVLWFLVWNFVVLLMVMMLLLIQFLWVVVIFFVCRLFIWVSKQVCQCVGCWGRWVLVMVRVDVLGSFGFSFSFFIGCICLNLLIVLGVGNISLFW